MLCLDNAKTRNCIFHIIKAPPKVFDVYNLAQVHRLNKYKFNDGWNHFHELEQNAVLENPSNLTVSAC